MPFKTLALAAALLAVAPAIAAAADEGAPAAPSGAPAAAAQEGSSNVGNAASKNEMKSHNENQAKQNTMDDPHKQAH